MSIETVVTEYTQEAGPTQGCTSGCQLHSPGTATHLVCAAALGIHHALHDAAGGQERHLQRSSGGNRRAGMGLVGGKCTAEASDAGMPACRSAPSTASRSPTVMLTSFLSLRHSSYVSLRILPR